jgi:hypothetical protein
MTATIDRGSTEQAKRPSQGQFVLVWGGLWAPATALLITLFDWYTTRHRDPLFDIVLRFVSFIIAGMLGGPVLDRYQRLRVGKKPSRAASITRPVMFIVLMLGLAFVLWTMLHTR